MYEGNSNESKNGEKIIQEFILKFQDKKFILNTQTAPIYHKIHSIVLTTIGLFIFMSLHPYIEASEQTILQKVAPFNRQGRVFGFALSVEQIASPLTAFFIGPITELFVIPFVVSQRGEQIFGGWFGTTDDRAIALVFSIAGIIGIIVTLLAFLSISYRNLSKIYLEDKPQEKNNL